jgi:Xaa-Pro aminopeptidase
VNETTRTARLGALREAMGAAGVDLLALAPTDNLRYMLGFAPKYDERACMLLVTPGATAMLMPSLNAEQSAAESGDIQFFTWADAEGPAEALHRALESVSSGSASTVAVDPEMRADHLLLLQRDVPGAALVTSAEILESLRVVKSREELEVLAAGFQVADEAVRAAYAACVPGNTELEVAEQAAAAFREGGCEEVLFTIVASGPNGAYPHHHTGSRRLEDGDAVVIDIGARRGGYASDITRMAYVGTPTERYEEVHGIVDRAVEAGLEAAAPGVTCGDVDAAVRGVIEEAGFGEYFVHRTGHGLGLSVHEPPWVMSGEDVALRPGMVHSIEPGIYLPGAFGVRLEEIVQITDDGCSRFSTLPREVNVSAPDEVGGSTPVGTARQRK